MYNLSFIEKFHLPIVEFKLFAPRKCLAQPLFMVALCLWSATWANC